MQKILIPTDFSNNALKAIFYASAIAEKSGANIYLLHVIEPAINMINAQADLFRDEVVKEKLSQLHSSQQLLSENYPAITINIELARGGIVNSVLNFAENEKMDLIVMGTTGASGLKEFFMGSVAAGVIGKSKIPVLTIPVSYEIEEPDAILFATNQFEKNKNTLEKVVAISKLFTADIHVVVFKDIDGDKNAGLIYNEEQLFDYLEFLKETFPDVIFKGKLLEGKDFEIAIDGYCNKIEGDMIAMVTYPKSVFEKFFRKSVTRKMAFHSTTPILIIPAIL